MERHKSRNNVLTFIPRSFAMGTLAGKQHPSPFCEMPPKPKLPCSIPSKLPLNRKFVVKFLCLQYQSRDENVAATTWEGLRRN